ncbi:P-loop NTPase fold protein [Francisella philomiragia]|uniref:P-loop NTPase fold protein n=1 Tax=Francisella philomiragia TaxID=28110 RepID=UPI001B8C56F4|nr:P-loop NTPase fold protein [Francisella philomiragia]QUE31974.1 hypothetical protein IMS64_02940 [Francisella philomiragia]
MDKDCITSSLKKLLEQPNALCIAINGQWGVGKTYFWNEFTKESFKNIKETTLSISIKEFIIRCKSKPSTIFNFKDIYLQAKDQYKKEKNIKTAVYISLFGKETLSQVKEELLIQIYRENNWINKLKNKFGTLKYNGLSAGALLTFFEKKDFENLIICFDDFERISDKLNLKDVFGLISELKEQKNCHIVMILNNNELEETEILGIYKDKIVDYEFEYNPSPENSFDLVKNELLAFHQNALDYFYRFNINNIRSIKRVINALNDYSFIQNKLTYYIGLEKAIVNKIIGLAYVNAISQTNFEDLDTYNQKYSLDKTLTDGEPEKDKEKEELSKYLTVDSYYRFTISDLETNIIEYLRTSIVNKESINMVIDKNIARIKKSNIQDELQEFIKKSQNDLTYTFEEYVRDVFNKLNQNKSQIEEFIDYRNFLFYIEELMNFDKKNEEKYRKFAIPVLKKYIENCLSNNHFCARQSINQIVGFDNSLKDFYEEEIARINQIKISDKDAVKNIMKDVLFKRSWDEEPQILSSISIDILKEYLLSDMNFMYYFREFIDWVNSFSIRSENGYESFRKNLIKAMEELLNEGTQDQKTKLAMILERYKK